MGGPQPWRNDGAGPLSTAERVRRFRERQTLAHAKEALAALRQLQALDDEQLVKLLVDQGRAFLRRGLVHLARRAVVTRRRATKSVAIDVTRRRVTDSAGGGSSGGRRHG